jgi:hypothetical protein
VIPIPSVLAAAHISVTGWTVLAVFGFLAVFGNRISDQISRGTQ